MARRTTLSRFQESMRREAEADAAAAAGNGHDTAAPGFRSPPLSVPEQLQALVLSDDIAGMPLGQIVGLMRLAVAEKHVNATEAEIRAEAERRWLDGKLEETAVESKPEDLPESDPWPFPQGSRVVVQIRGHQVRGTFLAFDPEGPLGGTCGVDINETNVNWGISTGMTFVALDQVSAEEAVAAMGRAQVVDVAPDGIVEGVRPAEMTPDRGDVTTHHTITDEAIEAFSRGDDQIDEDWNAEPRFSGGGADDDGPKASGLIPTDQQFNGKLYRDAPELANIAEQLIERHGFLGELINCEIRWYWKRKTGVSKGRVKIGFMKRASDLLGHFSGADFIGWLSATTARDGKFTDSQIEAAVFHQLLHVGSDDNGNWIFAPHDFEGFAQEVRVYGTWTEGLKLGGSAFTAAHQMGLFDSAMEEDDGEDNDDDDEGDDSVAEYTTRVDWPDTSGELPTGEEIDASRRCPHGHDGCDGRHDLADDILADPAVI